MGQYILVAEFEVIEVNEREVDVLFVRKINSCIADQIAEIKIGDI